MLQSLWGPVYKIEVKVNAKAVRIKVTASVYNKIDVQIHVDKALVIIKLLNGYELKINKFALSEVRGTSNFISC